MIRPAYELLVADFVRVFRTLPKELRLTTGIMFFYMLVLAILETTTLLVISLLAMSIASPEQVRSISFIAWCLGKFPALGQLCADPRFLAASVSTLVVVFTLLKNGMAMFTGWKSGLYSEKISLYAGEKIFRQYLYSPYMWHLSGDSNVIFQALSWRGMLSQLVVNVMTMYTYFLTAVGLFVTVIAASPEMLLLSIVVVVVLCWATYASVKNRIDKASMTSANFARDETVATRNAMQGIREVLIYRQQDVFFDKFVTACRGAVSSKAFLAISSPIPPWILEVIGFAVIPTTIIIMLTMYDASMTRITAVVSMLMLAAWRILPILSRSLASLVMLRTARHPAMLCLEKLEETLRKPAAIPAAPTKGFAVHNNISFEHLSFTYPKAEVPTLTDITFDIPSGKRIGIIGPSGAGKSTIVGILSGLMEPSSGRLLVDGKELDPGARSAYAMQVGYVPQAPYILAGTVAENVAFSAWGKPYDSDRVLHACQMAALDIVETHPQGILIPIGEHGAGLSGGQAQRVSIARALYANPSLLIFDEATSALDHNTESAILETIYALPNSITVVLIAHRLSTVEQCDIIFWIDKGKIIASGTPQEILPRYKEARYDKESK